MFVLSNLGHWNGSFRSVVIFLRTMSTPPPKLIFNPWFSGSVRMMMVFGLMSLHVVFWLHLTTVTSLSAWLGLVWKAKIMISFINNTTSEYETPFYVETVLTRWNRMKAVYSVKINSTFEHVTARFGIDATGNWLHALHNLRLTSHHSTINHAKSIILRAISNPPMFTGCGHRLMRVHTIQHRLSQGCTFARKIDQMPEF